MQTFLQGCSNFFFHKNLKFKIVSNFEFSAHLKTWYSIVQKLQVARDTKKQKSTKVSSGIPEELQTLNFQRA